MIRKLRSYNELTGITKGLEASVIIGFFGPFSKKAVQAQSVFESFASIHPELRIFMVDVSETKDIHGKFSVTEVPTVIAIHNGKVIQYSSGAGSVENYESIFLSKIRKSSETENRKPAKRVTVYSTPVCPWCTKVKTYLKSKGISFTDVDVSKDQKAAMDLMKKSGQSGVPQIEINGKIIVGFDQPKIDKLLGL